VGSKKQDLCALGGILMAWQLGMDDFQKLIRRKDNRLAAVNAFKVNATFDYRIRCIEGETLCKPEKPASLSTIIRIFNRFIEETAPGQRVPK
jgi:hypothetical protein